MLGRVDALLGSVTALRELRDRLSALEYDSLTARLDEVAAVAFEPATRPLQRHEAERLGPEARDVAALFRFRERLPLDAASRLLGERTTDALTEAGVLSREGETVRACFRVDAHRGRFFLADDLSAHGDAVMGIGPYTLDLFASAEPRGRPSTALDLGCGAGVLALLLAERCERVIATDISPRAVTLTRVNAALNAVDNVEARVGDLFAPVEGERFDLVVSQPPFVPFAEGVEPSVYADGGVRGDELLLRLLEALPRHLEGRALIVAQLALGDEETAIDRLSPALRGVDAALLESPGPSLDAISIGNAAYHHPDLGEAFARECVARRVHFTRIGCTRLLHVLLAIQRSRGPGHVASIPLRSRLAPVRPHDVDRMLQRLSLAHRADFARAKLALAERLGFAEEDDGVRVMFPKDAVEDDAVVEASLYQVLHAIDEKGDVVSTAASVADQHRVPLEAVLESLLPIAREAVLRGILVPRA